MIPYQPLHETLRFLIDRREHALAISLAERVYHMEPTSPSARETFSKTLFFARKDLQRAEKLAAELSDEFPGDFDHLYHWAQCLHRTMRTKQALNVLEKALQLRPGHFEGRLERSLFNFFLGEYDAAFDDLKELLKENPSDDRLLYNLGWFLLHEEEFVEGLRFCRRGRPIGNWGNPKLECFSDKLLPRDLTGKKILWYGEAGQGDQIINARFISELMRRGAEVDVFCHPALAPLLQRLNGVRSVFSSLDETKLWNFDFVVPCMDAPIMLGSEITDLDFGNYLFPLPEKVSEWKDKLGPKTPGRLRVGIRWQGSVESEPDMQRTVPAHQLFELGRIPGVELYSFQKDEGSEKVMANDQINDLSPELLTWDDTLAAMTQMDLMISSCTSTAHLAAASGIQTWILVPSACYYIWATPGNASPWYRSATLFRQKIAGDWMCPLTEIKERLSNLLSS